MGRPKLPLIKRECVFCNHNFLINRKHKYQKFCSNKCKFDYRRGKTFEEFYGIKKATRLKKLRRENFRQSEKAKKLISDFQKGKTWEEKYGKEKAEERRKNQIKRLIGKNNPFYNKRHTRKSKALMSSLKKNKTHEQIMGKEKAEKWHKRMSGENSPCWRGGTSFEPYDQRFTLKFKNAIRKRDNQICMACGKHREKLDYPLSIHHVNYDKTNSIPQNCISLCNECHGKTNYNRKYWIQMFQNILRDRYDYEYTSNNEIIINLGKYV